MSLYAKTIAILLLVASLIGSYKLVVYRADSAGYVRGIAEVNGKWDKASAAAAASEKAAILANEQHNADVFALYQSLNQKVKNDHEKVTLKLKQDLLDVRASLSSAGGLRVPRSLCEANAAGTQPYGASGRDATLAGTVELPVQVTNDLFNLVHDADTIVEQARTCQLWITTNGIAP